MSKPNRGRLKHEPEYLVWTNMKARCLIASSSGFARYGGRGISICPRWQKSYRAFLSDMGRRPSPKHQLDRIDNDGDYGPNNCRWATAAEQAKNRRSTRWITALGRTMMLKEWAERLGVNPQTIVDRLERGWEATAAVTTPARHVAQPGAVELTFKGRTQRLADWARETGLSSATISKRLKRGWSVTQALEVEKAG